MSGGVRIRSGAGPLCGSRRRRAGVGAGSEIRARRLEPRRLKANAAGRKAAAGAAARPRAAAVGPARQTAPVDLTGNWVSVVTEDWQWRMRTPAKGDYASVPLTPPAAQGRTRGTEAKDGRARPTASAA